MGYRLNRLDEPVFMAVPKPMLTEFGIHYRLESCDTPLKIEKFCRKKEVAREGARNDLVSMKLKIQRGAVLTILIEGRKFKMKFYISTKIGRSLSLLKIMCDLIELVTSLCVF